MEAWEKKIQDDFEDAGGIDALAADLMSLSSKVEDDMIDEGCDEPTIDCRLQYHDGLFYFHTGDSSYDQDHRGAWGCSCVGQDLDFDTAKEIATGLLDQVLDDVATQDLCKDMYDARND